MKIFATGHAKGLANQVAEELGIPLGKVERIVFPDKEKRIRILDKINTDERIVIFGSTGRNPDAFYMELFFLMDAAQRLGITEFDLVIPYLSYQRQDHLFREGEAVSLDVIVKTLEAVGAQGIITFDLHSIKIPEQFTIPINHLSALPLFAQKIKNLDPNGTLVSPDMGGIRRIKLLSDMLSGMPFATIEKNRDLATGEVSSKKINGQLSKTAFIVDDMISTGGTISASIDLLLANGVKDAYVFATHPVLSKEGPKILQKSKAKKIFVTNSLEVPEEKRFEKLEIISLAPMIAEEIKKL